MLCRFNNFGFLLCLEEQVCLAMSAGSFHGVAFNPYETQLIVTANHFDGVVLYDMRKPEVYVSSTLFLL